MSGGSPWPPSHWPRHARRADQADNAVDAIALRIGVTVVAGTARIEERRRCRIRNPLAGTSEIEQLCPVVVDLPLARPGASLQRFVGALEIERRRWVYAPERHCEPLARDRAQHGRRQSQFLVDSRPLALIRGF
jgi:hypothetical protein